LSDIARVYCNSLTFSSSSSLSALSR